MAIGLTVILCLWRGWRPLYEIEHVNAVSRMLQQHLSIPYRLVLLTDEDAETAEVDQVLPGLPEIDGLKPLGEVNCFRRLRLYDPAYASRFGTEWLMLLDLDVVLVSDITAVIEQAMAASSLSVLRGRLEYHKRRHVNGALQLSRVGANARLWRDFDPVVGPIETRRSGHPGSDQAWLHLKAPDANILGREHGIYYFDQYVKRSDGDAAPRMVTFAGVDKPWSQTCRGRAPELWDAYMSVCV